LPLSRLGGWLRRRKAREKALDTHSWEQGEEILRALDPYEVPEDVTVKEAGARFMADAESRNLCPESLGKYRGLVADLERFFPSRKVRAVSTDDLAKFRETWKLAPVSARKKLERLKTFFRFAHERGWTKGNVALPLKPPTAKPLPTLPFSDGEVEEILGATSAYPNRGIYADRAADRVKAFGLLLLNSGLRIQDAVTVAFERFDGNRLLTRLRSIPPASSARPFWSGRGNRNLPSPTGNGPSRSSSSSRS